MDDLEVLSVAMLLIGKYGETALVIADGLMAHCDENRKSTWQQIRIALLDVLGPAKRMMRPGVH